MATVRIDHLDYRPSDNTILAATHGRGFFTGKFFEPARIGFETDQMEIYEGVLSVGTLDCRRYRDFVIPIQLEGSLEAETNVSFWVSGNASAGEDYEVLTNQTYFTLAAGATTAPSRAAA